MDGCRSGAVSRGACVALAALAGACASSTPPRAPPRAAARGAEAAAAPADNRDPEQDFSDAESLERESLAIAARGAPDATTRQIATLRQARALYQQFVDRARDKPALHDKVEQGRARIEDIGKSIEVLDASADSE